MVKLRNQYTTILPILQGRRVKDSKSSGGSGKNLLTSLGKWAFALAHTPSATSPSSWTSSPSTPCPRRPTSHQASLAAPLFYYHGYVLVTHDLFSLLHCFVSSYTPLARLERPTLQKSSLACRSAEFFWDVEHSQTSNVWIKCSSRKVMTHARGREQPVNLSPIASRDLWGK